MEELNYVNKEERFTILSERYKNGSWKGENVSHITNAVWNAVHNG